jgi:hypothetical protein
MPAGGAYAPHQGTHNQQRPAGGHAPKESLESGSGNHGQSGKTHKDLDVPPGTMGAEGVAPTGAEEPVIIATTDTEADSADGIAPNECMQGAYGEPPNSACGNPEGRPWHYDTRYFFGLTRGLTVEAGVSDSARPWIASMTLPIDVGLLPFAVFSGLSGT